MENTTLDFLQDADNVYRTSKYIVKQVLVLQEYDDENTLLMSYDTYYRRNIQRDCAYNIKFRERTNLEGKRLPSTIFSRKYIN